MDSGTNSEPTKPGLKLDDNSNYEPTKIVNGVHDQIGKCPIGPNRSRISNGFEKSFTSIESNLRKEQTDPIFREGVNLDSSRIRIDRSDPVDRGWLEGSRDHDGSFKDGGPGSGTGETVVAGKLGCVKETVYPRDNANRAGQAERNRADSTGGNRFEAEETRQEEICKLNTDSRNVHEEDLISWSEEEEDSIAFNRNEPTCMEKIQRIRDEERIEGSRGTERDQYHSGKEEKIGRREEEKDRIGEEKDPSVIHGNVKDEKDPGFRGDDKKDLIEAIQRIFDRDELPPGFEIWNQEKRYRWIMDNGSKELLNVPESLGNVIASLMRPGDCGRSPLEKPDWLDQEMFRRGQRFASDHAFGLYFANMLSLLILFAPSDTIRPMIISGKSGTPYTAFKRYLSTVHRVRNWYRDDPWTKGTSAYNDMQAVRKMHLSIRQRLCQMSIDEFETASTIKNAWCPAVGILREDFQDACPASLDDLGLKKWSNSPHRPFRSLNQYDMAATQFAFMGLPILYPESFGIHYATDQDLEGFCHLWRSIGYLLGMEDEYNFCRGSLEEVRQRSRDLIESCLKPGLRDITSEWEHMTRCLVAGINYYFPAAIYASSLVYLCDLINVPVPRFRASISFGAYLYMEYQKLVLCYFMKWRALKKLLNKLVHYAIDGAMKFDGTIHTKLEEKSAKMLINRPQN